MLPMTATLAPSHSYPPQLGRRALKQFVCTRCNEAVATPERLSGSILEGTPLKRFA